MAQAMKWNFATQGALGNADLIGVFRRHETSTMPFTNVSLLFFHASSLSR
jgi:hypothetical protein